MEHTFKVGDRVKHADEDAMDALGTVIDVQDTRTGQWLTIEWDHWYTHADQVKEA